MKKAWLFALIMCCTSLSYSQQYEFKTDETAKEAVSKLAWLTGDWEGSGWRMGMDRQKHTFEQTETIRFKLDSTVLLIEGHGIADGRTIHDAMAIMTYDTENGDYDFRSKLANGRGGDFSAELKGDTLYWYPGETMRYVIWLDEQGRWYEKGEVQRNGQWFQFMEMTLVRKEN